MLDLRIDGGLVVRPGREPSLESIAISDGKIAAVGQLSELPARQTVDAAGLHVLPGIIDTHVHIGHTDMRSEWATETRLAAVGGVTTALVYYRDPEDYDRVLPEFIAAGDLRSYVDFGVHLAMLHDEHLARLEHYVQAYGVSSFKMYTTYKHGEVAGFRGQDDGFILDAFRKLAAIPGTVISVHCENDDMVERGKRCWAIPGAPPLEQWSQMRPVISEVEAIRRMALFAREAGCRLYVPHVSSARGVATAVEERLLGTSLFIETCAQYLGADLIQSAGVLAKVNPPVRSPADVVGIWKAFSAGLVDTVGTDHCAIVRKLKPATDLMGAGLGFPGLGTLLPCLLDGVSKGRARMGDIARAQANAASIFNLTSKGRIQPGFDADLVLVDLTERRRVDGRCFQGTADFSPFADVELAGWPVMTISHGRVLVDHGEVVAAEGVGGYSRRLPT